MAGNLVIVAIPDENDRVWKISSDKKPHMTLLFLGDPDKVSNLDQIMQFVEHAASRSLSRFYLPVDYRGELGADKADVLFFKKSRYDFKAVKDFRDLLLKDSNIRTAYDATSQFEAPPAVGQPGQPWIPHLTLGYPETPAKPIPDDQISTFFDVCFDRIAVWTGDFEGPEWRLRDYWDEMDELGVDWNTPMSVAMSSLQHLSEEPWSNWTKADYTVEQWHAACLIHMHDGAPTSKSECKLPVKTPDGALNRNGVHAAAAALAGARGGLKGVSADQKTKAANALKRYYAQLDEEPPESLTQSTDLVSEFMAHYGVKGMKWGVRNNTSGVGETKREGLQKFLDPQGHDLTTDVGKTLIGVIVPIVAPLTWPAQIRMVRGGVRGVKAKALDSQEKKFAKNAMSPKNFVAIHNGSLEKANRDIDAINKKYPEPNKDSATRKRYDDEVLKSMQDAYRASANSLTNKAGTQHLDLEFVNDGLDFKIHARQGPPTPMPTRIKHAAEDDLANEEITVEITGKIKRDAAGHIVGFEFDHLDNAAQHSEDLINSMAQAADLGAEFLLAHYGIKGMRWGVRKASDVGSEVHTDTGVFRRQTKVRTTGGEGHPAHEDAVKVAESTQKLKKSGTAALSNKELRDVANRIQLEEQVKGLMTSRGRKFVRRQVEQQGQQGVQVGIRAGAKKAAPIAFKKVKKGAATAATVAALGV